VAILGVLSMLASCAQSGEADDEQTITIHGGSAGGAYNTLIEDQLNHPVIDIRYACDEGDRDCQEVDYTFKVACGNGGSKRNLFRLGMPLPGGGADPGPECKLGEVVRENQPTDLALVQNFWIHAAVQADCDPQKSDSCSEDIRREFLDDHGQFEDLRIVLPVYYGRIQIVSTADVLDSASCEEIPENAPDEAILKLACKKVFLGSEVTQFYGGQILGMHPLLTENVIKVDSLDQVRADEVLLLQFREVVKQRLEETHAGSRLVPPTDQEIEAEQNLVFEYLSGLKGPANVGRAWLACGLASAFVISGEVVLPGEFAAGPGPSTCSGPVELRQVPVPAVIIDEMVFTQPYYQKLPAHDALANLKDENQRFESPMLAVTTYLVTTANEVRVPEWSDWSGSAWREWFDWKWSAQRAETERVRKLTNALVQNWQELMLINRDLVPLRDNIYKRPALYHAGAEAALKDAELLGSDPIDWRWAAVLLVLLGAVFWRTAPSYDRLGEQEYGFWSGAWHVSKDVLRFALILGGTIALFSVIVTLIRGFESEQAFISGLDDPISRSRFEEVLLWMFTFVSSGYENNVFPQSTLSRILVSFFAIVGIAIPIWLIVSVIDRVRERRLVRSRGGEFRGIGRIVADWVRDRWRWSYRRKGMLLICGWNKKAPGLVYTLTCPDSPFPGIVHIVADMEVEYPISHWRFNKRRVRFYRGDASHRSTLERAEARRAEFALILADDNATHDANSTGVLTALALERLGTDILVSGELSLTGDDREFSRGHLHNIVDSRDLTRRMLSVACFNRYVLDYVLDALSPDVHFEWYSKSASKLRRRFLGSQSENLTVGDYARALHPYGVRVVAVRNQASLRASGVFSPGFASATPLDLLDSIENLDRIVADDAYLVCAADHPRSFRPGPFDKLRSAVRTAGVAESSSISVLPQFPENAAVLVIGGAAQVGSFSDYLEESFAGISVGRVSSDEIDSEALGRELSTNVTGNDWTHVVLLSSIPKSHSAAEHARYALQADSDTILRANTIRIALREKKSRPVIIAEVNNTHSRQLAVDAGVTTVVPSALLVERILARVVTGRGYVSEALSELLDVNRDSSLRSVKLDEEHPLIGMSLDRAMNTWFADCRVLGIMPAGEQDKYRNNSDDFDYHFIMCPTDGRRNQVLERDDIVIVQAFPE
jgi:Trk K+ transport system NAD-binding subunit